MHVFYVTLPWVIDQHDYNCSSRSLAEWKRRGSVNEVQAAYFLISGILFVRYDAKSLHTAMEKLPFEGVPAVDIARKLGTSKDAVYNSLNRLKETGAMKDRTRSGRPKTVSTSEIVKRIREKLHRKSRKSMMRELARDERIS
ncbi:unnamed protein product [Heligmosomoides polygyrus]|uniref:Paired domain-containing protein n=1 Tax=Heligmosomoides polygyrus TaxID=6339 RepID=A0A183F4E3_HELPZ|nr:unnamed protein product [Heligmosomoides polygyrus]